MLESRALKSPGHTPRRSRLSPPLRSKETEETTKDNVPSLRRWQSPMLIINSPHTTHSKTSLFIVVSWGSSNSYPDSPPTATPNRAVIGTYLHIRHIMIDHKCPDLSMAVYYDSLAWRFEHFCRSSKAPVRHFVDNITHSAPRTWSRAFVSRE